MPIERISPALDRLASDDQELEELGNGCEVAEGPLRRHQAGRLIFWRRRFRCPAPSAPMDTAQTAAPVPPTAAQGVQTPHVARPGRPLDDLPQARDSRALFTRIAERY